jgi:hypothetical protein
MYTLKNHDLYYRQEPHPLIPNSKFTGGKTYAIKFKTKAEAQFVLNEIKREIPNSNLRVAELT